jgi:hypothetical protein
MNRKNKGKRRGSEGEGERENGRKREVLTMFLERKKWF